MFNFLVDISPWVEPRGSMLANRVFEGTSQTALSAVRAEDKSLDFQRVASFPTLFAQETEGGRVTCARVGQLSHLRLSGRYYEFQFNFDPMISPISSATLNDAALELGIENWELTRTHWALKEADLFRALLRHNRTSRPSPRVFKINELEIVDNDLVAVMMPFDASFSNAYSAIQDAVQDAGLRHCRADEIWQNHAVIQDIVDLIDRAKVVICDCTGRNANVFYEIGIAHTLGREVILLTQSDQDIPFDLRHLRYLRYLNNGEGLRGLRDQLARLLASPA